MCFASIFNSGEHSADPASKRRLHIYRSIPLSVDLSAELGTIPDDQYRHRSYVHIRQKEDSLIW